MAPPAATWILNLKWNPTTSTIQINQEKQNCKARTTTSLPSASTTLTWRAGYMEIFSPTSMTISMIIPQRRAENDREPQRLFVTEIYA